MQCNFMYLFYRCIPLLLILTLTLFTSLRISKKKDFEIYNMSEVSGFKRESFDFCETIGERKLKRFTNTILNLKLKHFQCVHCLIKKLQIGLKVDWNYHLEEISEKTNLKNSKNRSNNAIRNQEREDECPFKLRSLTLP